MKKLVFILIMITFFCSGVITFSLPLASKYHIPNSKVESDNAEITKETDEAKKTIDDYFTIQTLEQHYGDDLETLGTIDTSVISYDELRYLSVLHVGFDGEIHQGELIVNQAVATEVLAIFRELYDIGFPIEKMKAVNHYHNSDTASMLDNNTSAFNFREITGGGKLSNHALGLSIDINPKINPYVSENAVLPSNGAAYLDREQSTLGMIKKGDDVVKIFKKYGWSWGGDWDSIKDYQHFEKEI